MTLNAIKDIQATAQVTGPEHKQHMTEKGAPPGVGSLMWDAVTDVALGPLLLSVGAMQGALPAVSTAVEKTMTYKNDPVKRGQVSSASLTRFLYDGGNVAFQEAHDLRKLHANIKGKLADGSSYYALNPATFRIVPDTFLDGIIRARECVGDPLSSREKQRIFEEYTQLCLMFGIPRKYIPASLDAFHQTYLEVIEKQMEFTPAAKFIINDLSFYRSSKRAKNLRLKLFAKLNNKLIAPMFDLTVRGTLHPTYREMQQIPWTAEDEKEFKKICRRIKRIRQLTPRFLRDTAISKKVRGGEHGARLPTAEEVRLKELANQSHQVS